jgi:hypothetical protein
MRDTAPGTFSAHELGFAMPCPEPKIGCGAHISYLSVETLARANVTNSDILDVAMTHEIGHLLLGRRSFVDGNNEASIERARPAGRRLVPVDFYAGSSKTLACYSPTYAKCARGKQRKALIDDWRGLQIVWSPILGAVLPWIDPAKGNLRTRFQLAHRVRGDLYCPRCFRYLRKSKESDTIRLRPAQARG